MMANQSYHSFVFRDDVGLNLSKFGNLNAEFTLNRAAEPRDKNGESNKDEE